MRMPTLGSATLYGAAMGRREEAWTSARMEAVQAHRHRIGIAIFHDGNPGHLWRGEVASRFGEVLVATGVVMWLATSLQSSVAVGLAVVALGLPFLLVGPLGSGWENSGRPGIALKWLNYLRIVLVAGIIALNFYTIPLAIYPLLFLLSLFGRLHDAARTGAIRACLAPGEPEHVANDIYIGGAVAAVLGPILAALLFVVVGQLFLVVGFVAAIAFLISGNSEGLLDTLPPGRRAFLLATPESLYPNGYVPALGHSVESDDLSDEEWREEALPAWYQQGPTSFGQALAELRSGLGLAGISTKAGIGLWSLSALGLAGGAFSTLLVFYVTGNLSLPSFYLGPLMAAEGTGLALGSLALSSEAGRTWGARLWFGMLGTAVLFVALGWFPSLPVALVCALLLGLTTALAVSGARRALYLDFDPVEQRSVTSAENWVAALGSVCGALFVVLFLTGTGPVAGAPHLPHSLPGWSAGQLLVILGVALAVAAVLLAMMSATGKNSGGSQAGDSDGFGTRGRLPASARGTSEGLAYTSGRMETRRGAAESDEWESGGEWDGEENDFGPLADYEGDAPSSRYPRQPGGRGPSRW
jgi:hypothetical protein